MCSAICYVSSPETTLVKFLLGFYIPFLDHCCNIDILTNLSSSMLSKSDYRCEGSRFESHPKFFKLLLNICLYITLVCLFVLYSGLRLSGLSSLFLHQKYWSMLKVVDSNPATGSYSTTFILSIQIRNFPTPLPYHTVCMCSCPTLVKSAILPKTTCLCSSLTVILL